MISYPKFLHVKCNGVGGVYSLAKEMDVEFRFFFLFEDAR